MACASQADRRELNRKETSTWCDECADSESTRPVRRPAPGAAGRAQRGRVAAEAEPRTYCHNRHVEARLSLTGAPRPSGGDRACPTPEGRLVASLDALRVALADRYRLDRELGQGGIATVYRAHDLSTTETSPSRS